MKMVYNLGVIGVIGVIYIQDTNQIKNIGHANLITPDSKAGVIGVMLTFPARAGALCRAAA
jgi:hypothetical protein